MRISITVLQKARLKRAGVAYSLIFFLPPVFLFTIQKYRERPNMITLFVIFLLSSHYVIASQELKDENQRNLAWLIGEVRTDIPLKPFSLVLSPTSRNLSEYEVSKLHSILQDHLLRKYQESADPMMNFATEVDLTGILTSFKPTQIVNGQFVQSQTIVSVKGGVAVYPFDIYQRAPTLDELHDYTMSVLGQGLASLLRSISGLSLVTSIEILPYQVVTASPTASPTLSPTASPTKSPTNVPTKKPSRQPTLMPTRQPTKKPTVSPTHLPTKHPTKEPTVSPTRQPTNDPTQSPQQQQQQSVQAPSKESIVSNSETIQNLQSGGTPWYPIVGAIGGVTLIVGAILMIRRKKQGHYLVSASKSFSDLDGSHSGSPSKKVLAPAFIPSDSEDDVSEFSAVFPIGISPLLPEVDDRYLDTDSLNEDIDFPQVPFHQDHESFGSAKFF